MRCNHQIHRGENRRATSLVEVIVSLALLGIAVSSIGRFVASVHRGLEDRELSARIGWETLNVRERIASWNPAQINQARIESLPISSELSRRLGAARWVAQVTAIDEPSAGLEVDIALHCDLNGQAAVPVELTFWIPREAVAPQTAESQAVETPEVNPHDENQETANPSREASDETN